MGHNQDKMNQWYLKKWQTRDTEFTAGFEISGRQLADNIKEGELVLDVGCATNPFSKILPNCIGVDPGNEHADVHSTIEDFVPPHLFDVAFCLGSVNFGTEEIISTQVAKVVECLKPTGRIYWRLMPYIPPKADDEEEYLTCFPWTFEKLQEFADKHGFTQSAEAEEFNLNADHDYVRLYAEWHR